MRIMNNRKIPKSAKWYAPISGIYYRKGEAGDFEEYRGYGRGWEKALAKNIGITWECINIDKSNKAVDWNYAPEDAQFYSFCHFRKHIENNEYYYENDNWFATSYHELNSHKQHFDDFEMRPSKQTKKKKKNDKAPSEHYLKYMYRVSLTEKDKENGFVDVKLDPYRVGKVCNVGGGAMEQVLKKSMRGVDKGHSERVVLEEIISAARRGIEMIDEDERNG